MYSVAIVFAQLKMKEESERKGKNEGKYAHVGGGVWLVIPQQKLFILVENEYLIRAFRELDDDTEGFHSVTYYYLGHSERRTRTISSYWSSSF